MSFSTTACLEIFSTDYADGEFEMPTRGKAVPSMSMAMKNMEKTTIRNMGNTPKKVMMTMTEKDMHLNGQAYSNSQQEIIHGPSQRLTVTMLIQ